MELRTGQKNESDGVGRGRPPPTLLFIVGPPAVGKMTVGDEIARRTGFRLFHNHLSIEPVLRVFDHGTEAFSRLVDGFRRSMFEEVAKSDLPGLIFTWVWAFDLPSEAEAVERYAAPFRKGGSRVLFAELNGGLEERLRRNETGFRLSEKASKRDVARSKRRLLQHEARHTFSSAGAFDDREDWLRIDTTQREPEQVAEVVIRHFGLRRTDLSETPSPFRSG